MQRRTAGRGFHTTSPTPTTAEPTLSQKAAAKARGLKDSLEANPNFQLGYQLGDAKIDELQEDYASASIMDTVRVIGGAMIGIAVLVVVLNEVFSLDSIANSTGPFSGITDRLESIGVAAMGLVIVGLLVLAANRVMGFFGRGGM
jgi:hypothetical protein